MQTIAALFVEKGGVYAEQPNVDVWDITRNAKLYCGPYKVIAHPPCERWGRYWFGGPSAKVRRTLGDDGGCFASALYSVRAFGGVLEHPEASAAWRTYGLNKPPRTGGWVKADDVGGFTCCVEQGGYGHKARKATWLYANGVALPELRWGRAAGDFLRLDDGFHSAQHRALHKGRAKPKRLSKKERVDTPIDFRNLLIAIVRG